MLPFPFSQAFLSTSPDDSTQSAFARVRPL